MNTLMNTYQENDMSQNMMNSLMECAQTQLVALSDMGLIRVAGKDAAAFLHSLLTNDVTGLPPDGVRHGALCNAMGRMVASFLYWRDGDDYLLQVSADILPTLLKRLSLYLLRAQVRLTDESQSRVAYGLFGPQAGQALSTTLLAGSSLPDTAMTVVAMEHGQVLVLGENRYQIVLNLAVVDAVLQRLESQVKEADLAAWHLVEIRAGMPRITQATQESFTPQMVNFEVIGGVNFKKGCYPGQEIVARTQYLGRVKRRMYRAAFDTAHTELPIAGAALFAPETGEQVCGNLICAAPTRQDGYEALAVIPTSCAEAGEVRLGAPNGPRLSLLPLPYSFA